MDNPTDYYEWLLETEELDFSDIGYYIGFYLRHKFLIHADSIEIKDGYDGPVYIMSINGERAKSSVMSVRYRLSSIADIDIDQSLPFYFDYKTMMYHEEYYNDEGTIAEVLRDFTPNSEIVYYVNTIKFKISYEFLVSINQKILSNEILYIIAQYMA